MKKYIFRGDLILRAQQQDVWAATDIVKTWFDVEVSIVGVLRTSPDEMRVSVLGAQVFTFKGPDSCEVTYSTDDNGRESVETISITQPFPLAQATVLSGNFERAENTIEARDA